MILRKPYAVLIKYFRIIHLIIGIFSLFVIYKINKIMSFFTGYFNSSTVIIEKGIADGLFGFLLYFSIILILIATISIIILMAVKKKPIILYIYTIITQIIVTGMLIFSSNNIKTLEVSAVDVRTLKLNSDLLLIVFILEIICSVLIFVRATGFNIKKFNFGEDLEELEITERDNEEFEVSYEVDTNTIKRDFLRALRDFRYFYGENRLIINVIGTILLITIIVLFGYYYNKNHKTYSLGTYFYYPNYKIKIMDSYVTKYNYRKEVIDEEKVYVLVKVEANKTVKDVTAINTTAMELTVEGHKFYPSMKKEYFIDIGTSYNNQKLSYDEKTYLLVYELPKSFETSKMKLTTYTENGSYKTNISPQRIDKNEKEHTYNLGDTIDFSDSVFTGIKLALNSMELSEMFTINYTLNVSDQESIPSIEYIRPSYTGSEDKLLMKLTGSFEATEDIYLSSINLGYFIETYGKIKYEKEGKTFYMSMIMEEILPKKVTLNKTIYVEVSSDLQNAEHISLVFDVHSQKYVYQLK